MNSRIRDLRSFYRALGLLAKRTQGLQRLAEGLDDFPRTAGGVYFFFDDGELRSDSGRGPRVVRVGTHGVARGSRATLRRRLMQHRGRSRDLGGRHRSSVFRKLVGSALIARDGLRSPEWGLRSGRKSGAAAREQPLEEQVSQYIRALPYLWVRIEDEAGPESDRAWVESNSIALLSQWQKSPLDPPSETWLGHSCDREKIRESGLWNSNHVREEYDPKFLEVLGRYIEST